MKDVCSTCLEPLRVECGVCGRRVPIENGKVKAHDAGAVHAGHMTWGACKGSGREVIRG